MRNHDTSLTRLLGLAPTPLKVFIDRVRELNLQQRPDFQRLLEIANQVPVAPHVEKAIVELCNPDVYVHCLENPELVLRLNNKNPSIVAAELGKIEAGLDGRYAAPPAMTRAPKMG